MISIFLSLFLANVLIIPEGSSTAQPVQQEPQAISESASEQPQEAGVGTVVQLKGTAEALSRSGTRRELSEGEAVYQNETVETSAGATLQIELNDESIFTLSEKTSIRVNELTYDESAKDGILDSSVAKGVFRFISGKIAKVKPENVNIDIPSGTIGIRGTIVVGEIEGEKCVVGLEAEEGDMSRHRIVVFNEAGGQKREVEITKPGYATTIEGRGQAPKPIFELPAGQRGRFQQMLPPKPQFAQGTKPGDPKRYEQLFDTGKMKERQEMMREKAAESEEGSKEKRPGKRDREEEKIKGPGGPNGPDSPEGFKGREPFQEGNRTQPFNDPKRFENSGELEGKQAREGAGFQEADFKKPQSIESQRGDFGRFRPNTMQDTRPVNQNLGTQGSGDFKGRPSFGKPFSMGSQGGGSGFQPGNASGPGGQGGQGSQGGSRPMPPKNPPPGKR